MAKANTTPGIAALTLAVFLLAAMFFVPQRTHALSIHASLGGGNALMRATSGQSQGLSRANPISNLSIHLTAASTRGGQPEETPPANQNSNTGNTTSSEQSDGENGADATSAGGAGGPGGNNGGTIAGDGGNGGDGGGASPGGWVRAGGATSNGNSVNMINVVIIKIGR